jgi:hypothetical protein
MGRQLRAAALTTYLNNHCRQTESRRPSDSVPACGRVPRLPDWQRGRQQCTTAVKQASPAARPIQRERRISLAAAPAVAATRRAQQGLLLLPPTQGATLHLNATSQPRIGRPGPIRRSNHRACLNWPLRTPADCTAKTLLLCLPQVTRVPCQPRTFVAFPCSSPPQHHSATMQPTHSSSPAALAPDAAADVDMHHRAFFSFEPSLFLADLGNIVSCCVLHELATQPSRSSHWPPVLPCPVHSHKKALDYCISGIHQLERCGHSAKQRRGVKQEQRTPDPQPHCDGC